MLIYVFDWQAWLSWGSLPRFTFDLVLILQAQLAIGVSTGFGHWDQLIRP
jgi:hypothetical protein